MLSSRFRRFLPPFGLLPALALGGCIGTSALDELDQSRPMGSPFSQALYKDYAYLARSFGDVGPAENGAAFDPRSLFAAAIRDIWLEIGFGAGEHLAYQAASHPDCGLIGSEVFEPGTGVGTSGGELFLVLLGLLLPDRELLLQRLNRTRSRQPPKKNLHSAIQRDLRIAIRIRPEQRTHVAP